MRSVVGALATAALLVSPGSSLAGTSCDLLVQHGITNITRYKSADHAVAFRWHKYCGFDYDAASDAQVAEGSLMVFGYGSGDAGYSTNQQRERLRKWCNQNSAFAENQSALATEAEVLSVPALASWRQCVELLRKGVEIKFLPNGEHDEFVHFEIDSSLDANLKYLGIEAKNYTCTERMVRKPDGAAVDPTKQPDIDNTNIQIDCTRSDPKIDEAQGVGKITFDTGYIAVNTSGPAFATSFPRVVSQYYVTPPGAVIPFDSSECPDGWQPFAESAGKFVLGTSADHKLRSTGGSPTHKHDVAGTTRNMPAHILEQYFKSDAAVKEASSMPPYLALTYCKRN